MLGYLNGNSPPSMEALSKIARACGVSVEWLVGDVGRRGEAGGIGRLSETEGEMRLLIEAGRRATQRNFHLRKVVSWMDHYFGNDEEQCLNFYETMKRDWPSFEAFIEQSLPPLKPRADKAEDKPVVKGKNAKYRLVGE